MGYVTASITAMRDIFSNALPTIITLLIAAKLPMAAINLKSKTFWVLKPCFLLGLHFGPEDGGDKFLRNTGGLLWYYKALQHKTRSSHSWCPL
jgi:hypothetical protein